VLAGIGGRDDVFDQVLPMTDPDDVPFVRGFFLGGGSGKDGFRGLGRLGAGCFEEALGESRTGASGVIEAVGLAGGPELVPAEHAEEAWDLELAGVDEGADLVVLLRALGDFDPELAAESDQSVAGEDF
jgi:hypothetical protein